MTFCYIPRWFTHPSTNRAQCRLTTLIEANALTTTLRCLFCRWLWRHHSLSVTSSEWRFTAISNMSHAGRFLLQCFSVLSIPAELCMASLPGSIICSYRKRPSDVTDDVTDAAGARSDQQLQPLWSVSRLSRLVDSTSRYQPWPACFFSRDVPIRTLIDSSDTRSHETRVGYKESPDVVWRS